jgi:hypothetical protein
MGLVRTWFLRVRQQLSTNTPVHQPAVSVMSPPFFLVLFPRQPRCILIRVRSKPVSAFVRISSFAMTGFGGRWWNSSQDLDGDPVPGISCTAMTQPLAVRRGSEGYSRSRQRRGSELPHDGTDSGLVAGGFAGVSGRGAQCASPRHENRAARSGLSPSTFPKFAEGGRTASAP